MKQMKQILVLLLSLALILSLCACGAAGSAASETAAAAESSAEVQTAQEPEAAPSEAPAPEETAEPAPEETSEAAPEAEPVSEEVPEPAANLPTEGSYTLFAISADGFLVEANELEQGGSVLTLDEDGSGSVFIEDADMSQTYEFSSWTAGNNQLTITFDSGSVVTGALYNGVIELDLSGTGESLLYYAMDGADISGYEVLTLEEYHAAYDAAHDSRLYALWKRLDTETGVHLQYRLQTDYLDSDQTFDVHGKGTSYYSLRTTEALGREVRNVTLFIDGMAYNLSPDDGTGVLATTTDPDLVEDVMLMDTLYGRIYNRAQELEYTTEDREMDGKTYSAEVFPENELYGEAAFYFDDSGSLVYIVENAPILGETEYTIEEISDTVDEALFDISGYDIQ